MNSHESILFEIFRLFGGAGLFIFGMQVLSRSLEAAAGDRFRAVLTRLTRNRLTGFAVGTGVSGLVHSGPATVMLAGFVNAGLISFFQSLSVMMGANVGTTLAMQVVSFDIGRYAYLAIGLGFAVDLFGRKPVVKNTGTMILAFGLLFLGIDLMRQAVAPFNASPVLGRLLWSLNASTLAGMAAGIAVSALLTAVMQSSGATIGILLALAGAGVVRDYASLFPLVLGAHIGTCVVTLVGASGMNISARRSAMSHLAFNLLGAVFAAALFPAYRFLVPLLSGPDVARQVANTHTLVQLVNAAVGLLLLPAFAGMVRLAVPSREKESASFLERDLMAMPENAISAALKEVCRMLATTRRMLGSIRESFGSGGPSLFAGVERDEDVVDRLKYAVQAYLIDLGQEKISSRQALMIQYVNHAAADIERVADHIESLVEVAGEAARRSVRFDRGQREEILRLFDLIDSMLETAARSLDPDDTGFRKAGAKVDARIGSYRRVAGRISRNLVTRIRSHEEDALTGYFFSRYVLSLDKVIKHLSSISDIEHEKFFFIKEWKLLRERR